MTDSEALLQAVESNRERVTTDSYTMPWREMISIYKEGDIIIDPDFQRLFRWSKYKQSEFIESIVLNIPTPSIFLAENEEGKFEIIDGLQRINTIIRFFSQEIFDATEFSDRYEDENDIQCPLVLTSCPILEELEGFDSQSIPSPLSRSIKNSRVNVILVEKQSDISAKYQVFQRLNRSGALLSDQEIRNVTGRLIGKGFSEKLKEIAGKENVSYALKVNPEKKKSMYLEELILRLLAICHSPEPFQQDLANYLDEFMIYASGGNFEIDAKVEVALIDTFDLICKAFPNGQAFRFREDGKGQFSPNLFDVVATGIYQNVGKLNVENVREKYASLKEDASLREVTGAGSNTKAKLDARKKLGERYFAV